MTHIIFMYAIGPAIGASLGMVTVALWNRYRR